MPFKSYMSYVAWIILATLLAVSYQLWIAPHPSDIRAILYAISIYGYFGLLIFILALLFFIPQRFIRFSSFLLPVFSTIWLLYLIADILVFKIYSFHLDAILLKMLVFDFKGMGLPTFVLISTIATTILLLLANIGLWYFFLKKAKRTLSNKQIIISGVLFFILFITNSLFNIWASAYSRGELMVYNGYFPIYYPITSHGNAEKLANTLPNLFPPEQGNQNNLAPDIQGVSNYPRQPLQCDVPKNPANILIIGLESWQTDSFNSTVMPKTTTLVKQGGTFYRNHLSGGTATVPGLFSLFTGVNASYYKAFKSNLSSSSSVLVNTLKNKGYAVHSFTASDFNRFNLRDLILPNVVNEDYIETKDDAEAVNEVFHYLDKSKNNTKDKQKPFLDFIFLLSSHSPYVYPESYTKFTPLPKVEGGYVMDTNTDNTPYKNDYYNSLFYLDDLIAQIIEKYKQVGKLDNTWIIITGDHAEEFNENKQGYWGHGSNFSRWQNAVPMIVTRPKDTSFNEVSKRSLHIDIVPTLLQDVLHCQNEVSDYSNGVNLAKLPEKRNTIISSYYEDTYLIDGVIFEKNTGKVYQWDNMKKVDKRTPDTQSFRELIEQQQQFLR